MSGQDLAVALSAAWLFGVYSAGVVVAFVVKRRTPRAVATSVEAQDWGALILEHQSAIRQAVVGVKVPIEIVRPYGPARGRDV